MISRRTLDSWVFSILAVAAVVLAWWGLGEKFPELQGWRLFPERIIKSVQFFASGAANPPDHSLPWTLAIARVLGVVVSLWAVAKVVAHVFAERIQEIRVGLLRGHSIVAGEASLVRPMIDDHRANHRCIVLADSNPSVVYPSRFDRERPLAVKADPSLPETLVECGIKHASSLFLLFSDDQRNIDVAVSAWDLARKRGTGTLTFYIHIDDRRLTEILENGAFLGNGHFRLRFFNLSELTARSLLTTYPIEDHPEYRPERPDLVIHAIIFGLGQMGESLVIQIARLAHFGNGKPAKITIVDRDCEQCQERLLNRNPQLTDILELSFISFDASLGSVESLKVLRKDACEIKSVFIAFDQDTLCLHTALEIQRTDPDRFSKIYVRKSNAGGVARLMELGEEKSGRRAFHFFGALADVCTLEMIERGQLDSMAKALHSNYCRRSQKERAASIESLPPVPWEELPEEWKESNRRQADHIAVKARQIGCYLKREKPDRSFQFSAAEIEKLAEIEHRRWVADRKLSGWTYGSTRDPKLRHHPMLVAWEYLSEPEQEKNREFIREIPAILERADYAIIRSI